MKRIFNKRLLSFLLALLMVLEMAPLSAVHVHATEGDHTDLSIDFNYQSEFANADAALLHEANQGFTVEDGLTTTEAEDLAWVQIFDGDLKREGGKFREVMESSDPDEKYIVLSQDVDLRYGSGEWEPIKVTSDKVLDLNGFSLTWWDNTNKEDGENWQSTNIYDHYLDKYFIYIQEGATLTIIDSSAPVNGYDTGKGTGRMEAAAQVIDAYKQQLDYYTHRDLFVVNGNLVIYGGTFQAGRQKDQYKSNFTWDKLADCLGKTLDLGLSIAEYATGLDAATAAMKDVEADIANRKPAQSNTSDSGENGTTDSATNKPTGAGGTQNQTVDTPASAGSTDNSQDRAQTVGERTGTDTTNNNTNNNQTGGTAAQTGGQNQANGKGTAKEDKNSLIAAEEKKVVAAALDKEKIMDMWDKGADVVNSIGSMLGNAEGTRTTQTIWGTVAKVNTSGTLVVYSGTLQGYGASPNLRNATIEIVRQGLHPNSDDKQKNDGGRAYIFGGIVEGYSGANCFNFVRAPKTTQTGAARAFLFWTEGHDVTKLEYLESSWTGNWKMNDEVVWSGTIEYPYTYELDASETNNMEILHYENQDEFVQNSNLDPIPIDTSNVVVRGGTFRTYSELTNQGVRLPYMKEIDSTGESMTFVKFTGTSGSVNLGLESFGEDMIRDGRIQLVDVYGDGTLVLMDETVDEAHHPVGLKHYRLYCGDTELRHIRYLDAYLADKYNYTTILNADDYIVFTVSSNGKVEYYYDEDICDGSNEASGYYQYVITIRNNGTGTYGRDVVTVDYVLTDEGEEHTCEFNYTIAKNDDGETHTWTCFCGNTKVEEHQWGSWNRYKDTINGTSVDSNLERRLCGSTAADYLTYCGVYQYRLAYVDTLSLDQAVLTDAQVNSTVHLNASLKFKDMVEGVTFNGDLVDPDTRITWTSSDDSVATVDENGNVTFVGVGTATITATSVAPTVRYVDGVLNPQYATASCEITVVCAHQNSSVIPAAASTCTVAGHEAHTACNDCGKLSLTGDFTDTVTAEDIALPLASHVASNVFGYNEEGHFRTCKYGCGYQFGAVTAHTYNVSAADCTTAKYCTRCKYEAEAKHGHDLIYMDELPATCTDAGIAACYNCMNCGKYFYDEAGTLETTEAKLNIRALGHQWADATCTDPKTCTREGCGMTEGEALGHSWHSATCETPETCGRCGETNGSALGHNWQAATCTAPKTCSTCLQTEGDKLPHSHDPSVVDCTTDAICPVCNQVIVPATGHSITDYTYDENNHMGTCSVCNEVVTEPHTLGEDNICTVCGYEYVPHVHDMAHVPAVAASCTTAGNVEHWICGDCGKTFADEEGTTEIEDVTIPATGHTEVVDAAVAATCTTTGLTEGSHCSVCDTVIIAQETIPALGHNMVDGTCTRCGYSEAVGGPQIISQPVDYVGMVGDTATFTVVAEGEGLKYQWYFYDTNLSSWQKSPGNTSATMSVEFKAYRNNQEYRCEITDSDGNTITTNVVKIVAQVVDLVIVTQPVDYVGSVNDNVSFTVEATGNGLTYQWYYSDNGGTTWVKSGTPGFATNNLLPILRTYRDGFVYYCQITDIFGNTVNSDVVSMTVKASEIVITKKPVDVNGAKLGELYYFEAEATGDNLEFRWEFSKDGGETWELSWNQGYNTPTLGVRMNANRDGYLYRCKIVSGLKTVVYTEPVSLNLQAPSAQIVTQPTNVATIVNKTIKFQVQATGTDLTYKWYRSNDKGATWIETFLSGYNTDTLSFVATNARAAMYMCKITDGSGKAIWSSPVKLQILSAELKILTQPESITCASGATATFTVEAQGDGLKYQWYASSDGGSTWAVSYLGGYNTDTFSFVVNASRAAKLYKCVITDAGGNTVETNYVSVTIG